MFIQLDLELVELYAIIIKEDDQDIEVNNEKNFHIYLVVLPSARHLKSGGGLGQAMFILIKINCI